MMVIAICAVSALSPNVNTSRTIFGPHTIDGVIKVFVRFLSAFGQPSQRCNSGHMLCWPKFQRCTAQEFSVREFGFK